MGGPWDIGSVDSHLARKKAMTVRMAGSVIYQQNTPPEFQRPVSPSQIRSIQRWVEKSLKSGSIDHNLMERGFNRVEREGRRDVLYPDPGDPKWRLTPYADECIDLKGAQSLNPPRLRDPKGSFSPGQTGDYGAYWWRS